MRDEGPMGPKEAAMDSGTGGEPIDPGEAIRLDGNAAGGLLWDAFGGEMTAALLRCGHCGREGEVGTLVAWTRGPGLVLRCPACLGLVIRVAEVSGSIAIDASGAAWLRRRA
jgi:hypothetical protein